MKKLMLEYDNLEKDIVALSYFAFFMLCGLVGYVIWLLYEGKIDKIWNSSGPLGALVAALLVSKVASRLLVRNSITREDDRRQDIVRGTHHLIAVINELTERVNYAASTLRDGKRPLIALTNNAIAIEKRFEVFLDRELYRFLNPESVDLIGRMRGTIFGLYTFSEALAEKFNGKPDLIIPSSESSERQKMVEALDALIVDLKSLDDQIRQLRDAI
ncbi:MAG: hypothetical protein ACOYOS_16550 [Syntrophales bacterium]